MKLNNLFSVYNKNLIVTGGDSGIGFEISKSLSFLKANINSIINLNIISLIALICF